MGDGCVGSVHMVTISEEEGDVCVASRVQECATETLLLRYLVGKYYIFVATMHCKVVDVTLFVTVETYSYATFLDQRCNRSFVWCLGLVALQRHRK